MGLIVHLVVQCAVILAVTSVPQAETHVTLCTNWCNDPSDSRRILCCDDISTSTISSPDQFAFGQDGFGPGGFGQDNLGQGSSSSSTNNQNSGQISRLFNIVSPVSSSISAAFPNPVAFGQVGFEQGGFGQDDLGQGSSSSSTKNQISGQISRLFNIASPVSSSISAAFPNPVLCEQMDGYCQEPDDRCLGMRFYNETLSKKYCGTESGNTVCCTPSGQVFTVDLENALSFAILNTVIYKSYFNSTRTPHAYRVRRHFTDQSRKDFIEFLRVLLKYLKFPDHVQRHTHGFYEDIYNKMKIRASFTTSDLLSQLGRTQNTADHSLFLSGWQPSVGCQNIFKGDCYANFWRYTCGLWKIFHTLTVSAYNDKNPDKNPLEVINAIRGFMVNYFDCNHCIKHFKGMYNQTIGTDPTKVDTTNKAILWLFCAHNSVNQQWQINPAAPDNYYPPHPQFPLRSACPDGFADKDNPGYCPDCEYTNCAQLFCPDNNDDCWTFGHPKIVYYNFSMPAILSYLKRIYGGPYSYLNTNSKWVQLSVTQDECPHLENARTSV